MRAVVVLVGLQASGKTTCYRQRFLGHPRAHGHPARVRVDRDLPMRDVYLDYVRRML